MGIMCQGNVKQYCIKIGLRYFGKQQPNSFTAIDQGKIIELSRDKVKNVHHIRYIPINIHLKKKGLWESARLHKTI